MLVGPGEFIAHGRRVRKALGGGMRQVGVLAAAGLVALSRMVERLAEDHKRARSLADRITALPGIQLDPETVETDIIIFGLSHPGLSVPAFLEELKQRKVLALPVPQGIRFVTNKDVGDEDVDRAVSAFEEILT
jgi:threonine aldolase